MVGYGAMMAESMVAIMATIAACVLQPGTYFAINSPAGIVGARTRGGGRNDQWLGIPGDRRQKCTPWRRLLASRRLFNRTGGAPAFAVGMAHIFSHSLGGGSHGDLVSLRHHV